jgi:hypothetical protein
MVVYIFLNKKHSTIFMNIYIYMWGVTMAGGMVYRVPGRKANVKKPNHSRPIWRTAGTRQLWAGWMLSFLGEVTNGITREKCYSENLTSPSENPWLKSGLKSL